MWYYKCNTADNELINILFSKNWIFAKLPVFMNNAKKMHAGKMQ